MCYKCWPHHTPFLPRVPSQEDGVHIRAVTVACGLKAGARDSDGLGRLRGCAVAGLQMKKANSDLRSDSPSLEGDRGHHLEFRRGRLLLHSDDPSRQNAPSVQKAE